MMSTPFPEELLSAYLDGELTPREREEVERHLDDSPDVREQLDELAEVSRRVQSLSHPEAPLGLHEQILARVQDGGSPHADASRPDSPEPVASSSPSPARPSGTSWRWSVTAACVLLVVAVVQIRRDDPAEHLAVHDGAVPLEMSAEEAELLGLPVSVNGVTYAPRDGSAESQQPVVRVVSLNKNQIQEKLQRLGRTPREGNTLAYLDHSGEVPLLIEFTVVDVVESMGQVQVLLRNQQAVDADSGEPVVTSLDGEAHRQFMAVYLELEEKRMADLLQEVPALGAVAYVDPEVAQEAARDYDHLARLVESRQRKQSSESAALQPTLDRSSRSDADAPADADDARKPRLPVPPDVMRSAPSVNEESMSNRSLQRLQQKLNLEPLVRNSAAMERRSQQADRFIDGTNLRAIPLQDESPETGRSAPEAPSAVQSDTARSRRGASVSPQSTGQEQEKILGSSPQPASEPQLQEPSRSRSPVGVPRSRLGTGQKVRAVLIFRQSPAEVPADAPR